MNEEFNTGLTLLVVGMLTVFIILALIVLLGKILIRLVNRYFPGENANNAQESRGGTSTVDRKKLAAIVGAVDVITKGEGHVASIKKLH